MRQLINNLICTGHVLLFVDAVMKTFRYHCFISLSFHIFHLADQSRGNCLILYEKDPQCIIFFNITHDLFTFACCSYSEVRPY